MTHPADDRDFEYDRNSLHPTSVETSAPQPAAPAHRSHLPSALILIAAAGLFVMRFGGARQAPPPTALPAVPAHVAASSQNAAIVEQFIQLDEVLITGTMHDEAVPDDDAGGQP